MARWFRRHGWMVYAVVAVAFLANILVQFSALSRGDGGPATVPALIFSIIAFIGAVVVVGALFSRRSAAR